MDHLSNQLYEWVITAAAASSRMDSGSARARGSTTSELRVPELKATAREADASKPNSRELSTPRAGASNRNAPYTGSNGARMSSWYTTAAIYEPTTTIRTRAIAGTGSQAQPALHARTS
ncbi:hypothetical protein SAMN05216535_1016 [Stutzerimonas xanthomarina]|uniref:Uncharacterized protein n=2 Tax=Stutzerimonas xanthomarina TaxID=271420 RepID=A0A1M5QC06_9GAMM|nr:hypothetical protein SAMN05216535_1016 [Stutzerimonas xanthomarina]SHH11714.1 hypothetical protein SAMN02744645_2529 [Stutzerimonas xanthomarina DSM 18231]